MAIKGRVLHKWIIGCVIAILTAFFLFTCTASIAFIFIFSLLSERHTQREINCAIADARLIPESVVTDLCVRDLMPDALEACDGNLALRRDVSFIFSSNIYPNISTYDEVSSMFGIYENYCDPPLPNYPNFRCTYSIGALNSSVFYNSATRIVEELYTITC